MSKNCHGANLAEHCQRYRGKPIKLVAIALAGCTAFDVINILRKKRQEITGYEVKVEADQTPNPPQVFAHVRIHHMVTGSDFSAQAAEDAIRLSEEKYCPVGAMVKQTAELHSTLEVGYTCDGRGIGRCVTMGWLFRWQEESNRSMWAWIPIVAFVVVYLVLTQWILPKLGVPT